MNKFFKPTKIDIYILKVIIITILLITILGILLYVMDNTMENRLKKQNAIYIEEYLKDNVQDEIISIEQKAYIPGFLDGGHYQIVEEDNPNSIYYITYTCYDNEMMLKYNISFWHDVHKKIELCNNEKIEYMKNYEIYNSNYALIESVVKQCGGLSTNLGYYNKNNLDKYILLIYTPNIDTTNEIVNNLHDKVYGGYAYEVDETTHFVNIEIPRFIFCNDKELYTSMVNNKMQLIEYLKDKDYDVITSKTNRDDNYIKLLKVIQILLEYKLDNFNVAENIAQLYKLENYVTDNETWIITYELEIGVNYYLNTYVLVK